MMIAIAFYWHGSVRTEQWLRGLLIGLPSLSFHFTLPALPSAPVFIHQPIDSFLSHIQPEMLLFHQIWQLVKTLTVLVVARSVCFLRGGFLFLALNALGFIDGLVQRDLRKFQAARESTFLFHRFKASYKTLWSMGYMSFLLWPWPFIPAVFCLIVAVVTALVLQRTVYYFKKYV